MLRSRRSCIVCIVDGHAGRPEPVAQTHVERLSQGEPTREAIMNCARCGATIPATAGACPSCGQTVAGAVSRTSYRTTLVLVLGGIAVLAALALWAAVALPPLISKAASTLNAAVAPIERQLDALRHGDLRAAYGET